jgi:outer membrane protein TolC
MRLPKTLTIFLLAIASAKAESPALDGTMPEDLLPGLRPLLKEAVERSPTIISANISLASAEAQRYSDASGLWPSASLNSSYQDTTESVSHSTNSTSRGLFYSGGIYQPIFEWGSLKNQALIGNLGVKIAERQYAEAYRLLAVSIREQYLGLIGKNIQLRNAQFNLKLSKEAMAAQQARFDSGSVSEAELGNNRMSQAEAELDADRAQEDFDYSKRVFTRLLGIDDLDSASIPSALPHFELPAPTADAVLAGFVGEGVESTFQNEVYKMSIKQSELSYSIAKVRLLPKLTASANYSFSNQTSTNGVSISQVGVQSESYALAANWTIFDGFATRGAKLAALEGKRSYERQRQTYVDSMIDQVTYLRHQLSFSARAMSMAEVRYNLFEAQVNRLHQDQTLGYASQASIDSGILTLYATDYQRFTARSDLYDRWTEFISTAGIDPALGNISPRYVR